MDIKRVMTCPLGSKCEEIKDNTLHVCAWYITLQGINPQTNAPVDDKGCAMAWVPILLVENTAMQKSTAAATESLRNETVKAPEVVLSLLANIAASRNKEVHAIYPYGPDGPAIPSYAADHTQSINRWNENLPGAHHHSFDNGTPHSQGVPNFIPDDPHAC